MFAYWKENENAFAQVNLPTVPCLNCNMEISIDEQSMLDHQRLHAHLEDDEQKNIK